MRREPNYLLLGATVATITVLFFGVLIFLAGAGAWGRSYQKVHVKFAHDMPLPKLLSGAEVSCGGMTVGRIGSVDFKALPGSDGKTSQDLYIVVDALIDTQVGLRQDCRIRAEGPPLGGSGTLVIVHRGLSSQVLADGGTIEGLAPAGLNAVVGTLGDKLAGELDDKNPQGLLRLVKDQLDATSAASLMFKINAIADDLIVTSGQIKRQLDPEQQGALLAKLDATLSNIKTITGTLRGEANSQDPGAMLGKVHGILGALNTASASAAGMLQDNRPTIQSTLNNVQDATAMIKNGVMPSLITQLDPNQANSLITKFLSAADKANATLDNIEQMSANGRNLLTVNQESIDAMIGNLRETSEHLRAASREIRRNPWRLLYQPSKNELKQEAVADAARAFSDAAGKLDTAFARLEAYIKAAGPSLPAADAQLKNMQEHLGTAIKNLSETETKFWELFAQQR